MHLRFLDVFVVVPAQVVDDQVGYLAVVLVRQPQLLLGAVLLLLQKRFVDLSFCMTKK
jgi:hypothetical protein